MTKWLTRIGLTTILALACLITPTPAEAAPYGTLTGLGGSCLSTDSVLYAPGTAPSTALQLSGTWVGTVTFKGSTDGVTFNTLTVTPNAGGAGVTTATANGVWIAATGANISICLTFTAYTSGAASVSLPAVAAATSVSAANVSRASYATSVTVTLPTSAASIFAIESGASLVTRLRYLKICLGPTAFQTTAGARQIFLFRTTAASTGGTARTPLLMDGVNDVAFAGIVNTGAITTTPAAPTQVANAIWTGTIYIPVTPGPTGIVCTEAKQFDLAGLKAPMAAVGVANGLALFDVTGGAGGVGNYIIDAEFTAETL